MAVSRPARAGPTPTRPTSAARLESAVARVIVTWETRWHAAQSALMAPAV